MLSTILIKLKDWKSVDGSLLGQYGSKVIMEVESLPTCPYQDASTFTSKVSQRCLPGQLGDMFAITEIQEAKALIEELGDFSKEAETLNELRLMKQVTDAELALVAVYEEVLTSV